jgi:hypothetical protein
VAIDAGAISGIAHRCDPRRCAGRSCCGSGYEVCVEEDEAARIAAALPQAARHAAHLADGPGPDGLFREVWPGLRAIRTRGDGLCILAYPGPEGEALCSLHSAALALGQELRELKPRSCLLWPLAMTGPRPPVLSVDPGAFRFPCNSRRPAGARGLDAGVAEAVRRALGGEFLAEFAAALQALRRAEEG